MAELRARMRRIMINGTTMSIPLSPDVATSRNVDLGYLDLIHELPTELILRIFLFLVVDDVLRCSLVSKRWHCLVCDLEAYFKGACATFGLSNTTLSKERWRYTNYREMDGDRCKKAATFANCSSASLSLSYFGAASI